MTGGTGPGAEIRREATAPGRVITWAVLRVVASHAVVTALYYLLPFDRSATGAAVTWLVAGLVVFVILVAFQVRTIRASPFPGLRELVQFSRLLAHGPKRTVPADVPLLRI